MEVGITCSVLSHFGQILLFVGLSPSGLPFGNTEKASCF